MCKLECFWTLQHSFHLFSHWSYGFLLLSPLLVAQILDFVFFLTCWFFRQRRLLDGSNFDLSARRVFLCFFFLLDNLFYYLFLYLIDSDFLLFLFYLFLHFLSLMTNLFSRLLSLFKFQILFTAEVYTKFRRYNFILTQKMLFFICYFVWRIHQLWKIMQFFHNFIDFELILAIIFGKMKFMHWRAITLRVNIFEKTGYFFVFLLD